MKKSFLHCILLAGLLLVLSSTQAYAGEIWGVSIVGYDRPSREVFGYSGTWLDFDAAYYYDPAVQGELYWQYNTEVPLDSGYSQGFGVFPAQVWLYSAQYQPLTTYSTYSNHFVVAYYYYCYDYCNYYYWYDPYMFDFFSGGYYGGWYGFQQPYYDPYCYVYSERIYVFSTGVSIQTPPDGCTPQGPGFEGALVPCPLPSPTPTPTPGPCTGVRLDYLTGARNNGIPISNSNAPPATSGRPYRNSTIISATGNPPGGSFTWSKSSNKVDLHVDSSTSNSSQVTITALSKSDAVGDVVIDVTYSVPNCGSHTEHINMTVQQPTTMHYVTTTVNRRLAPFRGSDGRLKSGWEKHILWRVYDQLGNPISYRLPISDTINNNANSCRASKQGKGSLLSEGLGTDGDGFWTHIYQVFSPACLRGGNCGITGYQEYTVNGFLLSNDRKSFVYTCFAISLTGDGTTPPSVPGAAPKGTEEFVDFAWVGSLQTIADDASYQSWTNILNTAHAQGSSQLLAQTRALERALFQSTGYANLNRSDEEFVTDLYYAYLQRDPDQGGYDFWLGILRSDNAQGLNGREHLLQAFEGSAEFMNLVNSLFATPPLEENCDPVEEQSCYNSGGSWDSENCICTPVCSSYEENMCYYYGGYWDSSQCRCYYY